METSPLTKELYSIDWAVRFEQFHKLEKANFEDLNNLLAKIEETIDSGLKNKKGLDNIEALRNRLNNAEPESLEWHYLSMLVNLHVIRTAIPKGLTPSATLSAIQIMGHMWKILATQAETTAPKATATQEKPAAQKPKAAATSKQSSKRAKPAAKSATSTTKTKKAAPTKPASKPNKAKENPVTENVVIKNLTEEAGAEGEKPLAIRCHEVADSLAKEYPQYTLTAIRVMTAEKLGVTRQYVENLDIKPARFK